ncbi:MAG: CsgG/HfaB family protein [Bacteroidales bacterium]|nr:CsgG/HfaB family protein [Bacteroidales bacterium]
MKKVLLFAIAALVAMPSFGQSKKVKTAETVEIQQTSAKKDTEKKTIKRKVAIGRFSNETQYGKGVFYDKNNDPMRKQGLDILSAKLQQSGKFILLEREDLDVLVKEAGADMQKIGADYIILGSITEFGRKNEGQQKVFSSTKTQVVEAGVSIRIVETASGLIIYSGEAKGLAETTTKEVMGIGGTAGYDATLSDKAISAALSQLVENIINECTDSPWRSYILDIDEDGNYIISGGASQGLTAGDKFNVYSKGKMVKNPQSGMNVELPGKKIGTVTVVATLPDTKPENEISLCKYEGENLDREKLLEKYYILND